MLKSATWSSLVAMAAMSCAAAAQDATPAVKTNDAGKATPVQLDAIVVTARRRDEVLQQVPMSVTALDAMELETRGAQDLGDLGAAVPNVTIYAARPFNNAITAYIRGVGQSEPVWGVDPGVAVYVDDVYLARPQAALLDILDVARIEVLRGPQGTLYGKNSIGGAIKYITRDVGDTFSGRASVTLGSYARHDVQAALDLPMGKRLGTRIAFGSFDHGGFGENLVTGAEVGAKHAKAARVATTWAPGDDVQVRVAYDRYRDRSGPRAARRMVVNPNDPLHTPPDPGNYDGRSGMPSLDDVDAQGLSATIDWRIDARWRLKSISAYRSGHSIGNVDFDQLPLPISDVTRRFADRQASQEFQLHADGNRAHAIAGLYFLDGDAAGNVRTTSRGTVFAVSRGVVNTRSAALYGDLTLDLGDRTSLELGLRYTSEKKTGTVLNQGYTDATFATPNGQVLADFTDSKTFASLSPLVNLSRRFTDNTMLYAQASRGFKSGGYNIRANTVLVPESAEPFKDETAIAYEAGAKTQWLQGRLTLDAAVFHTDYRNIQLSVLTPYDSDGNGSKDLLYGDFRNAGAGTIEGAELELAARTGSRFRWLGHVGYLETKYDEYRSKGVDIADEQRFTNAPRWTAGASAIADIPLRWGGWLLARVDGNYQSKVYPTTDLSEAIAQDGYTLWNASLTWRSPQQNWQVALGGQNLGDKAYRVTGYAFPPPIGITTGYYGAPRTVSLSMTYYF
jgi:iron complex outermembrane receptor protein